MIESISLWATDHTTRNLIGKPNPLSNGKASLTHKKGTGRLRPGAWPDPGGASGAPGSGKRVKSRSESAGLPGRHQPAHRLPAGRRPAESRSGSDAAVGENLEIRVGHAAVLADIQPLKLLLGRNPETHRHVDELEHHEGSGKGPDKTGRDSDNLNPDDRQGGPAHVEDPGGQSPPGPADAVDGNGTHRVVHPDSVEKENRDDHQDPGKGPDEDRRARGNVGAAGGDPHQPGQRPVEAHAHLRFSELQPGDQHGQGRPGRRRQIGVHENHGDGLVRRRGRSGVEPEPAQPEDKDAQGRQRHVMPQNWPDAILGVFSQTRAEDQGPGQSRPAAHRVNHRRSGKVDKAQALQPAAPLIKTSPCPGAEDGVNQTADDDAV